MLFNSYWLRTDLFTLNIINKSILPIGKEQSNMYMICELYDSS